MNDVFAIRCSQCGSPVEFNILTQNYHCSACGCNMPAAEVTKSARELNEKFNEEHVVRLTRSRNTQQVYSCRSCGANVMMADNELVSQCDFCGTSITKSDFHAAEFPQGIIPFFITRHEAVDIVRKWSADNPALPDIDAVKRGVDGLVGYYLPFEMLRGPLRLDVSSSRGQYKCGGYLEGIFVSQNHNLSNEVLDAAEPFDITDLVEFDFSFVAGHKALIPNISGSDMKLRILSEVSEVYRADVSEALFDRSVVFSSMGGSFMENILSNTVYLPMYVLRVGDRLLVVNGQTGRVAYGKPFDVHKSTHGFLARAHDGTLIRELHEFPKYKPKKPLFYETQTDRSGETREVPGVYEERQDVKLQLLLFGLCPMVWLLSALVGVAVDLSGLPMLFFTFTITLAFVIVYLFCNHEYGVTFREVYPKYKNGGSGNDDEVYWLQKSSEKRVRTVNELIIIVLLAILILIVGLWISYYRNGYDCEPEPRRTGTGNVASVRTESTDFNYGVAFMVDEISVSGTELKVITLKFRDIDGSIRELTYQTLGEVPADGDVYACRNIATDDYRNSRWRVVIAPGLKLDPGNPLVRKRGKTLSPIDSSDEKGRIFLHNYKLRCND